MTKSELRGLTLENPEITLKEIAEKTGKSVSTIERAASKMVKNGLIRYTGPLRGGKWTILKKDITEH